MPEEELSQISKLLRMKRHEQPPPEYFENFLREFQQRQRAELLRRPAWRIALERVQAHFSDLSREIGSRLAPSQLAYGGASAAVLAIAAVFTANMLQHPGGMGAGSGSVASTSGPTSAPVSMHPVRHQGPTQAVVAETRLTSIPASHVTRFTLSDSEIRFPDLIPAEASRVSRPTQSNPVRQHPRYILDSRPASYEPPFSF